MLTPTAHAIQKNFIGHTCFFANYDNAVNIVRNDAFVRSDSGVNTGALNINVPLNDACPQTGLEQTLGYFTQLQRPAVIWLWDHLTRWREFLNAGGANLLGPNTGMCAHIKDLAVNAALPAGLEIVTVSTPKHVSHFGAVVSRAFGKPAEAPETIRYYNRLAQTGFYHDKRIRMFVGYHNGTPVCSGTRFMENGSAGIYSIAALNEMRGRGFGSAVFHHILQDLKKCHSALCTLKASPLGINIYRKAGFKPVCDVFIYDNRDKIA